MLYYETGSHWLVAVYGTLVMAASSTLILGLLTYVESPEWVRRSIPVLVGMAVSWAVFALVVTPRHAFILEAVLQSLLSGAAGAILAGAGSTFTGRWLIVGGVLAQMTSHLFYLSTNLSGLDASGFIPYGLLIDAGAELAIGTGLLMSVVGYENLRLEQRVREMVRVQEQMSRIAELDGLTGTCTRHALRSWFDAWDEARPVSVLVLDIDGLDRINRRHGRGAGDEALSLVGAILKESTGDDDLVVRWGDDEFLAVMTDTDDSSAIRQIARLMRLLDESLADFPYPTPLRVSWGVASCRSKVEIPSAITHAEHQMQAMKDRRRREGSS
jgi:diguanylate cyclase (GGDEF)-like protein